MLNKDDKELLLNYLKQHKLMTIATVADSKPWVGTVYYVVDDNLNLYLLTDPNTEKGQNIAKNNQVACNIYDSHQEVTDQKVGMQIQGTASIVNTVERIKWMLKMWHRVNPGKEEILNLQNMTNKAINARVYKVTPSKIKFFSEELYQKEEFKVFDLT